MEVSYICDIPSLCGVIYERDMKTSVYICLFIYIREVLMVTRGYEGGVCAYDYEVRG